MFALAKLYFVCPLGAVVKTDHGTASAKFKDGAYYDVDIVTTHESFDVLEELKYSLCSHSPRIVLSRCDVNSSIKSEQKGLEIDTFPTILKEEIVEEEFCIKEELISHSPNFDTFLENDLVEEEEACRGNFFEDCPSLNILTQQEVVVNDISFQNAYEGVFHDHSYSVKNGESDDEIPSRISLPNEFEILDEQQKSVKDGRDASDRFPVYILHNDSQVDMDCHSNLSNSSVPDKFNIGDVIPDLNNITQEEIVVNSDFFESTVEAIPPNCERGADLHYCLLEPQEGPIIDVECSNELTSATGTGEGNQDVQNRKLSYARKKKQYFCVYCKKLYTALPRHLERRHRDEECVKQFCDLPKDAKITEDMNTRSKRTFALVTSGDKNVLDLPKYKSLKTVTTEEQTKLCIHLNHHQEKQADDGEHIGHDPRFGQGEPANLCQSSKSEYMKDSSDCESDEQVEEKPLTPIQYYDELKAENSSTQLASTSKNYSGPTIEGDSLPPRSNVDGVVESVGKFFETSPNVEQFGNIGPWTKKSSCPYCFQSITHFPRHLQRNHQDEAAVKEFLSIPVNHPKRKALLNVIRRRGNFISTSRTKIIRPVRRPKAQQNGSGNEKNVVKLKDKFVICRDCLGYFKRNYLGRHRKRCAFRPKSIDLANREQHLSAAQLFTVCSGARSDFYLTLRLKNEVFPIMRNDEISKTAMNDTLICCYAESLLQKHKHTRLRNVISNKMRELGRLLLTLKEITGLQRLFDVLKPQFFDGCVAATKAISGYDEETRTFKASSLGLHMGTTLKQVCDVATKMISKKSPLFSCANPEESLEDVKRLKNLVENHWNLEISSLALRNLNEQRNEKPKLLLLTQDVSHFQQFVLKQAEEACKALRENRNTKSFYKRLSECVLALTLLLNRKRIEEIQYLKSKTYCKTIPQNQQEELLRALSEAEGILTKQFKRVITEGKGSRAVVILFPRDVQEFIEVLFSVRNLCVPDSNEYLFANPNTRNGWLNGYHTLKKLAEESGVSNKGLFTSTHYRKPIATVLQVLNVTEDEMEQFAKCMGDTRKTYESFCRLPRDIYQTVKVSKVLIAINSGKGSLYKGKALDEIGLSDNEVDDSSSEENNCYASKMSQDDLMSDESSLNLEVQAVPHTSSEQRRAILKELLHRSNLIYNTNGNYNQGHLLVVRRPPKGQPYSATDYASCPVCRAFYSKRSVRKHIKRCRATARESANDFLDEQLPACICSVLQEDILPLLTDTKLVKVIQSDRLIVAYGNHLCEQYKNPERHGFIMESLEYIGRLFCAIKNAKPFVKDLASIFVPSHVKTVENAIETVAEVDDDEPWESGYNDVDDLRRVCVEAAEVWKAECLKSNDETRLKQTNYFLRLFNKYKEFMPEGDARRKWSTSTKARFFQMFKAHLESKRLPSNTQCRMAMKKLPSLQSKTVAAVKTAIFNEIRRRERDCQRKVRMNTSVSTSTHNV